jgi:hypothetical protein
MEARTALVRKKDFRITIDLNPGDLTLANEFVEAVHLIVPSFLSRLVKFEIYQPVVGNVHLTVMKICQNGLASLKLETLVPDLPEFSDLGGDYGNIIYEYRIGRVIEQETHMCKDKYIGDQFMVHFLIIEFENARVVFNEFCRNPRCDSWIESGPRLWF